MNLNEQSRKLQVNGKDIHKFGKVPSLTPRLQKTTYGKLAGYRLKENPSMAAALVGKFPSLNYLALPQFPEADVRSLHL